MRSQQNLSNEMSSAHDLGYEIPELGFGFGSGYIPAIPERYKNNQQTSLAKKFSRAKAAKENYLVIYKVKCTNKAWQAELSLSSVSKSCLTIYKRTELQQRDRIIGFYSWCRVTFPYLINPIYEYSHLEDKATPSKVYMS